MRYFKLRDHIFGYDETQEGLITDEMVELTAEELDALLTPTLLVTKLSPLTNRQFKLALLDSNLIDLVDTAINNIDDLKLKRKIQIEYEYATTFNRDSKSVAAVIELIGISLEEVDQIWIKALSM